MNKVYIIHENMEWTKHLIDRLEMLEVPYEEWDLSEGLINLSETPPPGIYYNRMSASSHTRGYRFAPELTDHILNWLELHGRTVINGPEAIELEVSKLKQYFALNKVGILTPKTIGAVGIQNIIQAAKTLNEWPFIIKHNRAGKGLGVHLIYSLEELTEYLNGVEFEDSIDGISLVQQYIESASGKIVRAEFIGGEFFYSVEIESNDSFELCPADNCQIPNSLETNRGETIQPVKFKIKENLLTPLEIKAYQNFLTENHIQVAALEFIRDAQGKMYTYDVNTNTNYNPDAEQESNTYAMLELASYLKKKLAQENTSN